MLNPNELVVSKQVIKNKASGEKAYCAVFTIPSFGFDFSKKIFRTASEALEYGQKVKARWMRLYDAAIIAMLETAKQELEAKEMQA